MSLQESSCERRPRQLNRRATWKMIAQQQNLIKNVNLIVLHGHIREWAAFDTTKSDYDWTAFLALFVMFLWKFHDLKSLSRSVGRL